MLLLSSSFIHSFIDMIEWMVTSVLFNQVQYQLRQNVIIYQLFVVWKIWRRTHTIIQKNKDLRNLLILIEYNDNTRLSLFKLILWFGTSLFYVLCFLLHLQLLLTLPIIILVIILIIIIILILIFILIYIIRSSYNQIYTYEWICSDCWLAKG